ncbi:hypothetical protein BT96DRAFT_764354, partial [Gymnopus androsaceus JB14]
KSEKLLVNEVTTLRQHLESAYAPLYKQWCKKNNFMSMLPKVVAACKVAAQDASAKLKQSTVDPHLEEKPEAKPSIPYSDATFCEAAIEWLVSIDQVTLEHPSFHKMIDIASRAAHGVNIPNCKATRVYIIARFKKNLTDL